MTASLMQLLKKYCVTGRLDGRVLCGREGSTKAPDGVRDWLAPDMLGLC